MEDCPLGDNCPNWHLWMDEIGGLVIYLNDEIAKLTETIANIQDAPESTRQPLFYHLTAKLEAYEDVRNML